MSLARRYIETSAWAILPDYLELMAAIEDRDLENTGALARAIESEFGRPVPGTRETTIRDGVAIVPVTGPLFRHADMFQMMSGATSFERLAKDIGTVMADDDVEHVIFDINSPGGEVDGTSETAALIKSFRGVKPMTSFISHVGASAALWIAAAADRVIGADTSIVGSVGVVASLQDRSGQDEKRGIRRMEFVSSQTPLKRASPFSEDDEQAAAGRAEVQKRVDSLATVFIDSLAELRGTSPEAIAATNGAVFVGQEAFEMGLLDGLSTLESLVQSMIGDGAPSLLGRSRQGGIGGSAPFSMAASRGDTQEETMANAEPRSEAATAPKITRPYLELNHPELVQSILADGHKAGAQEGEELGATRERERVLGISGIAAPGFDKLKAELMADGAVSKGDAALRILTARGEIDSQAREKEIDALKADEGAVKELVSVAAGDDLEEGQEEAAAISDILGHAKRWTGTGHAE